MRPQSVSKLASATGATAWVPVDYTENGFGIGLGVVVSATGTYTVEHTFDNIFDSTVTPTAYPNSGMTAATTTKDGNYAFPVRAIRLNVAANTGNITLTIVQGRKQ